MRGCADIMDGIGVRGDKDICRNRGRRQTGDGNEGES